MMVQQSIPMGSWLVTQLASHYSTTVGLDFLYWCNLIESWNKLGEKHHSKPYRCPLVVAWSIATLNVFGRENISAASNASSTCYVCIEKSEMLIIDWKEEKHLSRGHFNKSPCVCLTLLSPIAFIKILNNALSRKVSIFRDSCSNCISRSTIFPYYYYGTTNILAPGAFMTLVAYSTTQ